jgi:hypothetical protein
MALRGNSYSFTTTVASVQGAVCWQGPRRSVAVTFVCGEQTELLTVAEPERCTYTVTMSTPAECTTKLIASLKTELAQDSQLEATIHDEL